LEKTQQFIPYQFCSIVRHHSSITEYACNICAFHCSFILHLSARVKQIIILKLSDSKENTENVLQNRSNIGN